MNANSASEPFLIYFFDHEANVDSLVLHQVHHQLTQILMALQVHSHFGRFCEILKKKLCINSKVFIVVCEIEITALESTTH